MIIGYDLRHDKDLALMNMNHIASMIVKIIHQNLYPRVGYLVMTHFQVFLATFRVIRKIQVNWSALVMHAMARYLKDTGKSLYFPIVITQLLEKN